MIVDLFSLEGKTIKKRDLPRQFNEKVRPDIIKRAVLSIQSTRIVPYGAYPRAGKGYASELSKRRRKYRGSYGKGISRTPRKILTRRGTQMHWMGATAPNTVGGRRAHPPKAEKIWRIRVNKKERKKAIRSALAATLDLVCVQTRGHRIKHLVPVIDSKIEEISKTQEIKKVLVLLDLKEELLRTQERKVRAGRGKTRGRKYKTKTGPLLVVSKKCPLELAASNIPGVEVCKVKNLNVEKLAPGTIPGRLTIFTDESLKVMEQQELFLNDKKSTKNKLN